MPHRCCGTALQVCDATDVGRHNHIWLHLAQIRQLAVTQLFGYVRHQYGVGTGRATAQVSFVCSDADFEAQLAQVFFYPAAQLLAVLQRTGRVKGDGTGFGRHLGAKRVHQFGQQLAQVAR